MAKNRDQLKKLIEEEIKLNGDGCYLNHINVSGITDMSALFVNSQFNGDISEWNVSKVTNMQSMFKGSQFNGNISKWVVSNVDHMENMFENSPL